MRGYGLSLKNKNDMSAMWLKTNIITTFLQPNRKFAIGFFAIFYVVGIFGTVISFTHSFFLMLFPWALLLSFLSVLLFNEGDFDFKTIIVIAITAVSGFFIEVAGISTHQIFGNYTYGETLGLKVFDTPLMIGINWAILVFATGSVVQPLSVSVPIKIFFAAVLMVFYDILMEFTAPILGMWTWEEGVVPARNYVAWFIIAVVFHSIYKILRIKTCSSLALPVLTCQVVFFIFLIIFFR
jgi:putative membrane protein